MKVKHVIALVLIILGTNLLTYGIARYQTTKNVLTQAQVRLDAALKKEGLYERFYPTDRPASVALVLAIQLAGGLYYGWNEDLSYWVVGGLLVVMGICLTRLAPRATRWRPLGRITNTGQF